MPTAEVEAWEIACREATDAVGTIDEEQRFAVYKAEYEQRIADRRRNVTHDAHAVFRAMDGWARVENEDSWRVMVQKMLATRTHWQIWHRSEITGCRRRRNNMYLLTRSSSIFP